ncbi:CRISPR-associated protein Cas4 [Agarivorans sp. QJM3NY_29]|uniref:CRISPR-associated protein Cas4 n=1 Tax=unclassified Agarivorans TaxID=2636026 RepID=UPI003D7E74CA
MTAQDQRLIPLSALQHYAFCPRQCALIHNEQLWAENYLTAHGQLLHQRVDSGEPETRQGVRFERGVHVNAPTLGLTGKLDLVEKDLASGQLTPVEYKRGKAKQDNIDAIQLCAQALCLEEMTATSVEQGALWYWQTRRRELVTIDASLRQQTLAVIAQVHDLFSTKQTPVAEYTKRCKACSLIEPCQPLLSANDPSSVYIRQLYDDEVSQ